MDKFDRVAVFTTCAFGAVYMMKNNWGWNALLGIEQPLWLNLAMLAMGVAFYGRLLFLLWLILWPRRAAEARPCS